MTVLPKFCALGIKNRIYSLPFSLQWQCFVTDHCIFQKRFEVWIQWHGDHGCELKTTMETRTSLLVAALSALSISAFADAGI